MSTPCAICENRHPVFGKQITPKEERVQQQSGSWAMTGQMPVPSGGWTPFKT
jgi:hypothetical protein